MPIDGLVQAIATGRLSGLSLEEADAILASYPEKLPASASFLRFSPPGRAFDDFFLARRFLI